METVSLSMNGKIINCSPEMSILQAALENGIYIPTLCHHPDLKPHGACRMCLVEEEKSGRLFASCVTPVADQMCLQTHSGRVVEHRRNIVRLMMAEHPESCLICSKGNSCLLRKIAGELDFGENALYSMGNYIPQDQSNSFIFRDLSKCILCGKCIRACKELVLNGTIDYNLRGFNSRPSTVHNLPLFDSNCTFCGTCVSVCPTGALVQSTAAYAGTADREHETVCGFCGVGCRVSLGVTGNRVIEANPSSMGDSVNGITLCVRGHFGIDFLEDPKRLLAPRVRKNNEIEILSWDDTVKAVLDRLLEIKTKYGSESIGFYGSSKCTNEENYLFQKIARAGIGTSNIDNGGFVYGRNLMNIVDKRTGGTCRTNRFSDLENTDVIFVAGAEPGQSVPVLGYHIKRAVKKGATLIVMDHRETELVMYASLWLKPRSGVDLVGHYTEVTNGVSAHLYRENGADLQFVEWFTENYDVFTNNLENMDLKQITEKTQVGEDLIKKAARLIMGKKTSFVVGGEILEQKNGELAINALVNLSLMAGSFGCQGGSIYTIAKENNLIGSWDMGTVPDMLPGRQPVTDKSFRKEFEDVWGTTLPSTPGLDMTTMIEAAEKGALKALYILGENPLRSLPQPERVMKALANLEFLVVQDILETETTEMADVVLPGAAFSEKSGSFTNMEGRIQFFDQAVSPPGKAKSDFDILCMIAHHAGLKAGSIEEVRMEISRLASLYANLSDCGVTAWLQREIVRDRSNSDEKYKRISFANFEFPGEIEPDKEYPLTAVTGSFHYHAGSGTRTGISMRINNAPAKGEIELSKTVADRFKLEDGNEIRVVSPYGSISRKIKFNSAMNGGTIFIPRAYRGNDVMKLFALRYPESDRFSGWKRCQVRIEKV